MGAGRRVDDVTEKGSYATMSQLLIVYLESGKREPVDLRLLPDADRFGIDWVVVEWDDNGEEETEEDEEMLLEIAAATGDDPKETARHKLKRIAKAPRWSNLAGQILKHLGE
jgi:hypothetical protein